MAKKLLLNAVKKNSLPYPLYNLAIVHGNSRKGLKRSAQSGDLLAKLYQ